MADIPVEKTGGSFWPLLLGLLALLFLVWLAFELFDDEPDADELLGTEDNTGIIDDVEIGDDDEIVTLDPLYDDYEIEEGAAEDYRVGRSVDFDNARVVSVVGDSAFFIGADDMQRVLVVLEDLGESQTGARGTDGVFNIDEGDMVSIEGTVMRYADGSRGTWELPDSERERMLRQGLYVRVDSADDVEVMDGEEMMEEAEDDM